MDLLERARALAACPLFAGLAPAVVIRLAERARSSTLAPGERRTDDAVWVVADGSLAITARGAAALDTAAGSAAGAAPDAAAGSAGMAVGPAAGPAAGTAAGPAAGTATAMPGRGVVASAGAVIGLVRVVAPATPAVDAIAERPTTVLAIDLDDVRDVLEEDPAALAALASALARALLEGAA